MKKDKLYNVIFPVWLIFIMPPIILFVIPANFIIDSLVLIIALKLLKVTDCFKKYKSAILKVWGYGFLVDIFGSALLLLTQFMEFSEFWYDNLIAPIASNPFSKPLALVYALVVVAICGFLIYFGNYRLTLKKTNLDNKQKKFVSLLLAVITAPYLFLLPTSLFY